MLSCGMLPWLVDTALQRERDELHWHLPPCKHELLFPVHSHWPSPSLWDLDLWGLCITIKFDSNKLKVLNGCMEVTTHSIVWALGSLTSTEQERGTKFPPYVSASFLAHIPEPLDPVTIFQRAAIQWSDSWMKCRHFHQPLPPCNLTFPPAWLHAWEQRGICQQEGMSDRVSAWIIKWASWWNKGLLYQFVTNCFSRYQFESTSKVFSWHSTSFKSICSLCSRNCFCGLRFHFSNNNRFSSFWCGASPFQAAFLTVKQISEGMLFCLQCPDHWQWAKHSPPISCRFSVHLIFTPSPGFAFAGPIGSKESMSKEVVWQPWSISTRLWSRFRTEIAAAALDQELC